jgi:hypothetical protein
VEWNISRAAGLLAAFGLDTKQDPVVVHASPAAWAELQRRLVDAGISLAWVIDVGVADPSIACVQLRQ